MHVVRKSTRPEWKAIGSIPFLACVREPRGCADSPALRFYTKTIGRPEDFDAHSSDARGVGRGSKSEGRAFSWFCRICDRRSNARVGTAMVYPTLLAAIGDVAALPATRRCAMALQIGDIAPDFEA